jgi:hypothetical protein
MIKETDVYYSYTQSRWFYCFPIGAPSSHLAHLSPLFPEVLHDHVIRSKELPVGLPVAETQVARGSVSSIECTMNTLLEHCLPDDVTKMLCLGTERLQNEIRSKLVITL